MVFALRLRVALPLLALLCAPMPTQGARKTTPAASATASPIPVDLLTEKFRANILRGIAGGAYRTVAVGIIDGKQRSTAYFGHRDGAQSLVADDSSRFEIGAVSDVFTNLLLAQSAIGGKLHLADPVAKFLPPGFPFGDSRIAQLPIESLATQRSGLPFVPANLYPANLDDPYADYATEDLLAFLALFHGDAAVPEDKPTEAYSIINGALLAQLLARLYGDSFADVLARNVLTPLGMLHTTLGDENLLTGYARGEAVAHQHYAALAGATGLRSTLPDLLGFLQLSLSPNDSALRSALLLGRQPRTAGVGADQTVLGWNTRSVAAGENASWPIVWRASETGGFSVFLGFRVDRQRAIVLLANTSEDLAALGIAWLEDGSPPSPPHGYAAMQDIDFAAYPGLYQIEPGSEVVVRADNGALSLQLPGAMPQRLHAVDKDVFISDVGGVSVTFMRDVDTINGLVLHLNGNHLSATRLSERAPRLRRNLVDLAAREREQFVGDYRLDAITWLRVGQRGDALSVQMTMSGQRVVYAYAPDRFADFGGSVDLAFSRDVSGHIANATLTLGGVKRIATPLRQASH